MKNTYLFITLTALISLTTLIQADQPYLTKDDLLSYQGTLWRDTKDVYLTEARNEIGLNFEEYGVKNPRLMTIFTHRGSDVITKTIKNKLEPNEQTCRYTRGSAEYKELNRIFRLFDRPEYHAFTIKQPSRSGDSIYLDNTFWKIASAGKKTNDQTIIHLIKSKHLFSNIYKYMIVEKHYDRNNNPYISQETSTVDKSDPNTGPVKRNVIKETYYPKNPRYKQLAELYQLLAEESEFQED